MAAEMAGKSFIFLLSSVLMLVLTSAHRPLVVERHEFASESTGTLKMDGQWKKREEETQKWETKGKKMEPERGEKADDMEKWEEIKGRKRMEQQGDDGLKPYGLDSGLYDVSYPEPYYPGGDAGFHVGFGPLGFGFGGGLQWGANPSPLYVVPYNQPYVVVSPYSVPYSLSPPYQYPTPYQQPGSGNDPPKQSGPDGPYPASPGGCPPGQGQGQGQGQGPYQNGWGPRTPSN